MQRMKEKALALRDHRESKRLEFVQKAREEQWRATCDDLRTRDTKIVAKEINRVDRRQQLEFAAMLKAREAELDAQFNLMYEQNRLDRIKVEEAKHALRVQLNAEVKDMLDQQMSERSEILAEEASDVAEEATRLKNLWAAEEARQIELERLNRVHQKEERARVAQFNKDQRFVKDEKAREENEFEVRLLKEALQREAEADAHDRAEAEYRKQSMLEYQRYVGGCQCLLFLITSNTRD